MPSSRAAKKRARQNEVRRLRNRTRRSTVKSEIRRFLEALRQKDVEQAQSLFQTVTKKLDQTAAKGTFHKNTVARKKSRLAARLNALAAAAS